MSFVRAANPIWYEVDTTGLPLNDNDYAFFLTNTLPYLPQAVYQDPAGTIPWSSPLQFQPNGTLPNNLYFNSGLVYRIEFRNGPSQSDALIGNPIQNFIPGLGDINSLNDLIGVSNQIINSQFLDVNFVTPYTFTQGSSGTYTVDVAPGWKLILNGSGTTILSQINIPGNSNIPGNPPTALQINNSGWTSVTLQQTVNLNGAIFANGAIAMGLSALSFGSSQIINLEYEPSQGATQIIHTGNALVGSYSVIEGAINLPNSTNSNIEENAFVNFNIILPGNATLNITNVQVIGQSIPLNPSFNSLTDIPDYQEKTPQQQTNEEFNIYKNSLLQQPKNNLLVGWTFAINPWQFISTADTLVTNQTQYIADQTILHQETSGALTSGKGGGGINNGLQLFSVNGVNANRFALIQYIDSSTILPYWGQLLSSMVRGRIFHTAGGLPFPTMKMRIIYRSTLPPIISPTEPITGWDANGDLIFSAGWTAINPLNDVNFTLLNSNDTSGGINDFPSMSYNSFILPSSPSSTSYIGVVVYITSPINNVLGSEDAIAFDRISLVSNDFAIDVQPETFDESLRKCQFYFEKSYPYNIPIGSTTVNGLFFARGNTGDAFYLSTFSLQYKQTKRAAPSVIFWAQNGASNAILGGIQHNGSFPVASGGIHPNPFNYSSGSWILSTFVDSLIMQAGDTTTLQASISSAGGGDEGVLYYHYQLDSRLGV